MGPFVAILAVGAGALLVVALAGTTRVVTRSFYCPVVDREVTADFEKPLWGKWFTGVSRCTAFEPDTAITCGTLCLRTALTQVETHKP